MAVTAVVGLQWGDEAKGKVVDLLAAQMEIVARFNGGDNAGHTVVNPLGTFKVRLMPSGFAHPHARCVIGPGVVVNLGTLVAEVETIEKAGLEVRSRLWVSPRCHVVMPYHPAVEAVFEQARGAARTATTGRGIGPVFADKVSYNGIRLSDLTDERLFAQRLHVQLALKNPLLEAFGRPPLAFDPIFKETLAHFDKVRSCVREPFGLLHETMARDGAILLEGAQGALLDNIWGTYPYCTASVTLAGGACAGLGIPPQRISQVVGVAKAYTTRVGAGPMPTELHDEVGETLQREGQEVGTVTGRPRRCGWFDADLVRFTAQLNGATRLALTKLDVLDTLPRLKIGIGYRLPQSGERLWHYWELDGHQLECCEPVYIEMEGWQCSTRQARRWEDLPPQAQAYLRQVEALVGVPLGYISVGPQREATIPLHPL